MKRKLLLLTTFVLGITAMFAQIPSNYTSVYTVVSEAERAPITVNAGASYQILGPGAGWGTNTNYNFSDYDLLSFKFDFDTADGGKQVAIRMSINAVTKAYIFTLPENGDSIYIATINLPENSTADSIRSGGIFFYNGASHWSFTYTGTPATKATNIQYVALKKAIETPPAGYESIYSVVSETEIAPITIAGGASFQMLGPANGWGQNTNYNFTAYDVLAIKFTYDSADAGHQVALRFAVNGAAKLAKITLPVGDTTVVVRINLGQYMSGDSIRSGGMVFYNGASHWSFTYDSAAATKPTTIQYIAIRKATAEKPPVPYTSIYNVVNEPEVAALTVAGGASYQMLGPANGWGQNLNYDFSNFGTLAIKLTYDSADAGHQVALRFAVNGAAKLAKITLPAGDTTVVERISLAQYADTVGKILSGGMVFYNGATHWSFTYDSAAATKPTTIQYIAVAADTIAIDSIFITSTKDTITFGETVTLKANIYPSNATFPAVTWSSSNTTIATVDASGVVNADSTVGTVTITATSVYDNTISATYDITIVGPPTSGINKITLSNVKIYPSPAKNVLNITNVSGAIATIYSIDGVLLNKINLVDKNTTVDVSNLPSGIYLISIRNENETMNMRFIKK